MHVLLPYAALFSSMVAGDSLPPCREVCLDLGHNGRFNQIPNSVKSSFVSNLNTFP